MTLNQRHVRLLMFASLLLLTAGGALAAPVGRIFGTVTDPTRAVVPNASVTIRNDATREEKTTQADASGSFLFANVPIGIYSLQVSHTGFKGYRQGGLTLQIDQSVRVNAVLQLGETAETVTVEATPLQVDTRSGTISEVVTATQIAELPLNGRNVQQLVSIQAGVQITGRAFFYNANVPQSVSFFSISGAPGNGTNYILDGGDHNDHWTNVSMPTPNPDALQEFSVQTSNFTAEYGSKAGGVVNMVIKGGTNAFHGSLFHFLRNHAVNSRSFFALKNDGLKRNQYGGTIGGPVRRDKTFFFFGYQGTNLRTIPSSLTAFTPTAAQRRGDLTGTAPARDPAANAPFPNNQIPAPRLDPVMSKFLERLVPLPNGPNGLLTYGQGAPRDSKEFIARGDHQISSKDRVFGSYFDQRDRGPNSGDPANVLSLNFGISFLTRKLTAGESHIFSPTLTNEFRFTWGQTYTEGESAAPVANNFNWREIGMKIPKLTKTPDMLYMGTPFFGFYAGSLADLMRRSFQFANNMTSIRGRHELKFGGDFIRNYYRNTSEFTADGYFIFGQNRTGNPYADLVMGLMGQFQQVNPSQNIGDRNLTQFYFQDTYRAGKKLSLTLGVRYEPYTNWHSRTDTQATFIPGRQSTAYPNLPPGLLTVRDPGVPRNNHENLYGRVGPRLAFAYDPFGNGRTSIRGGYGIFYEVAPTTGFGQFQGMPPFTTTVLFIEPQSFADPYAGQVNPFPAPIPAPPSQPLARPLGTVFAFPTGFRLPRTHQWNLTVERQLPLQLVARVAYVGSNGDFVHRNRNINAGRFIPGNDAQGNPLSTTAGANVNARRPYQGYQTVNFSTGDGNSILHSMLVTVERRLARGLSLKLNYTLQKSLDDSPQTAGSPHQNQLRDPLGIPQMYGPSDFDRTHRFVGNFVWQLPTPANAAPVARMLLGGWQLTGIVTLQGGNPFNVSSAGDPSRSAGGPVYADYTGGCNVNERPAGVEPRLAWFNRNCFQSAAIGTFGNLGRNRLRGPGLQVFDAGVYRNFRLREGMNLQFRSEFFNLLNHANFSLPNAGLGNPAAFGTITATAGGLYGDGASSDPRVLQFALKLVF
ncbi:MAG: carboxypeptidase regulatory-like domain-containing protein [Bryobacteraceae bacterium]